MGAELFGALGVDPEDPRVRSALEDARQAELLIDTLVELRLHIGATQTDVAEEMETTQSAVSKFERAGGDPHLSTLQRYARAVGARLRFRVDVERDEAASAWRANYTVAASAEQPSPEESEDIVIPIVGLAS